MFNTQKDNQTQNLAYNIKLYRNSDGKLTFESSNEGRLEDISNQSRAKMLPFKKLMRNGKLIKDNVYLCKDTLIIELTKKEYNGIDALLYNYKGNFIFIVPEGCVAIIDL